MDEESISNVQDATVSAAALARRVGEIADTRPWLSLTYDPGPAMWRLHPAVRMRLLRDVFGDGHYQLASGPGSRDKLCGLPIAVTSAACFELVVLLANGGEVTISPLGPEWARHLRDGAQIGAQDG